MKKKRRHKWPHGRVGWLLGVCLMMLVRAGAQDRFSYVTTLDTVKKTAFYRIALNPGLVAKCRPDLADLRIIGSDGRFVPYVLKDERHAHSPIIPDATLSRKDSSNKHTYLTLQFPETYEIDRVIMEVKSPRFYRRGVHIMAQDPTTNEWTLVTAVTVDPDHILFHTPTVRTRRLQLDIDNADNPPLVINRVPCAQVLRYLVTYLQADSSYRLLAGNPQSRAPEYDLGYFTDSAQTSADWLSSGSPQLFYYGDTMAETDKAVQKTSARKDHSGVLLWTTITLALLLLLYLSLRMAKAVRQNDADDRL